MAKAGYFTPMLHVRSVEASIAFYKLLGFSLIDVEGNDPLAWARMHTDDGSAVMFLESEEPDEIDPQQQAIMLVLYTEDLPAFRAQMEANGVKMPEIERPPWMPSGHVLFRDPDGYRIAVNHWSDAEQQKWLRQLEQKRTTGVLPKK